MQTLAHLNVRMSDVVTSSLFDLLNPNHAFHRLVYCSSERSLVMFGSFLEHCRQWDEDLRPYCHVKGQMKLRQFWVVDLSKETYTNKSAVNMSSPVNRSAAINRKCCTMILSSLLNTWSNTWIISCSGLMQLWCWFMCYNRFRQWHRGIYYIRFWLHWKYLLLGLIHCWFLSFLGVFGF